MVYYSDRDLIVAPATPSQVRAPLAVIRVSGENAQMLLDRCFEPRHGARLTPWRAAHGFWRDAQGIVDDVVVIPYRAPRSYTGQDMLEIICHGNPVLIEAIVACVCSHGGRLARPGEFTQRAVINGKMDLLEAEGVQAVIDSHTRYQADLARRQAEGPLVTFVAAQVEEILQIQAHIEATIDYGEEDVDAIDRDNLLHRLAELIARFAALRDTAHFSLAMRRGFQVLITGKPNAGKSTLFNALVRQERAIVTELPGTTRDLISEEVEIGGLPVVLIDSAGIRDTVDPIEILGIEKIRKLMNEVDLILQLDIKGEARGQRFGEIEMPPQKLLPVWTKCDLPGPEPEGIRVAALAGKGIDRLEKEIVVRLSAGFREENAYLINQRQEETLAAALGFMEKARAEYEKGFGEEVLSSYLNSARRCLGELTGETTVEDLLDRMFSNFCLGK